MRRVDSLEKTLMLGGIGGRSGIKKQVPSQERVDIVDDGP